jgi:16S rRNA (cytosine1402-N4)-methyltransferase
VSPHVSVLAAEALEYLAVREDGVYVDCTAGAGGHSALIAARLGPGGRLVAIDRDSRAVALALEKLRGYSRATVVQGNYGDLASLAVALGIEKVDGVLIDAGLSSMQLDDPRRGFTFQQEGPLDMRMDPTQGRTAADYLAAVDEGELERVLRVYGDVPRARRLARAMIERREKQPIETTHDLVSVLVEACHTGGKVPDETRTIFQAIRIAVNGELDSLTQGIEAAVELLGQGGRLVCITFHSGEDRIVKNKLRDLSRPIRLMHADGRVKGTVPPKLRLLTKRPVTPSAAEIRTNPRAHSARLRAAEKV